MASRRRRSRRPPPRCTSSWRSATSPEDQDDGQEREFVVSPERLEWLREFQRRVGELARDVPKAETKRQRDGTAGTPPHRPGYRPRR
ncbi:hypothetical protein [Streptomyces malaysiensis]|uniref:Uncharacterized protein n=1 Tax=Streptomyces malaysiensis TaxID=92644 RepID=A0A2J7YNU4_STRMQ|nr:hypothetical protein [Streptomyces malaysiensis]PNG89702.1 hypothetical protein SMF913_25167 [Streptomyces malaysiensis]